MPLPISRRTLLFAALAAAGFLVVVLLVIFLSPGRPVAKYQPSDRNATAGEISEYPGWRIREGRDPSRSRRQAWSAIAQAGHCNRPLRSARKGSEGTTKENIENEALTRVDVLFRFLIGGLVVSFSLSGR